MSQGACLHSCGICECQIKDNRYAWKCQGGQGQRTRNMKKAYKMWRKIIRRTQQWISYIKQMRKKAKKVKSGAWQWLLRDKTEDHTCPMVQLVPRSDDNTHDRLGGRISPQIGAVLNQTVHSHQPRQTEMEKPLFIHFKWAMGHEEKKQQLAGRSLWLGDREKLGRGQLNKNSPTDRHMPTLRAFFTLGEEFLDPRAFSQTLVHLVKCESWCQTWVWARQAVSDPS